MEKREVIAYAITHAPPGVKGGPYWAERGGRTSDIRLAMRFSPEGIEAATNAANHADARVIRIVRARPSAEPTPQPSEASAVEVLRELVAWDEDPPMGEHDIVDICADARRVLAASGPDPMPVVRAAMRRWEARGAVQREQGGSHLRRASLDHEYQTAIADENRECAKYRKAGGK